MANARTTMKYYQDIADAIRAVNGDSTTQYKPSEMAAAIMNIHTGNTLWVSNAELTGTTLDTSSFTQIDGRTPSEYDLVLDSVGNVGMITTIEDTTATINKLMQLASVQSPTFHGTVTVDDTLTANTLEAKTKLNIPGGSMAVNTVSK